MIVSTRIDHRAASEIKVAVLLCALVTLGGCTNSARLGGDNSVTAASTPPPPPAAAPEPAPARPPPVDLAGKWKLSAAAGGCLMTLTDEPGSTEGKIAPAGGCPGNFFMSRKWSYDHDALTIRDFKGQALAELSFAGGHFEGQAPGGGALTLARP